MFNDHNIHYVYRPCIVDTCARKRLSRVVTVLCSVAIVGSVLSGCALPLPIQAASLAIDGVSYVMTNKSIMDHGISQASGRDCAMFRIVTEGAACRDFMPVSVANAEGDESVVYVEVSEIPPPIYFAGNGLDSEAQ